MDSSSLHSLHLNSVKREDQPKQCAINVNLTFVPFKVIYFCFFVGQSSVMFRSVFMKHLGMSTTQNGIIYAIDRVLGIVFPPILGAISDKSKRPKTVLVCTLLSGAILYSSQCFLPVENQDPLSCYQLHCNNESTTNGDRACFWEAFNLTTNQQTHKNTHERCQMVESNTTLNWTRHQTSNATCTCVSDLGETIDEYGVTFWSLLIITLLSSISVFSSSGLLDAFVFYKFPLRARHKFGYQRMWGSVGFGVGALTIGYLKDVFATLDFGPNSAFIPFAFCPIIFWSVSCITMKFVSSKQAEESQAPKLAHLKLIATDIRMVFFALYTTALGYALASGEIYLFWLAEQKFNAPGATLGWLIAVTCVLDTIMCLLSGTVLKRIKAEWVMSVGLFLLGLRLFFYTTATETWHLLVIEVALRGVSWTVTWIACCNHIASISPPELRATTMSVAGACLWGIGYGTCGIVGGILYEKVGGENMFLISFGLVMCSCVVYVVFLIVYKRSRSPEEDVKVEELKRFKITMTTYLKINQQWMRSEIVLKQ